jgi:MinD superfamily P-loop ATPase
MGLVVSVASGKGGTGKTTLVASFAALADSVVVADCDVYASNLHMLLNPEVMEEEK